MRALDASSTPTSNDRTPRCPLCRAAIGHVSPDHARSVLLERIIEELLPRAAEDGDGEDGGAESEEEVFSLPLFLLGSESLFPGAPLPLHVFEPRYRRMMGACLAGSGRFGIVPVIDRSSEDGEVPEGEEGTALQLAEVGTVARIRGVQQLPDGRLMVDAVGDQRFRVLDTQQSEDGYAVARVQYFGDNESAAAEEDGEFSASEACSRLHELIRTGAGDMLPQIEKRYARPAEGDVVPFLWWVAALCRFSASDQVKLIKSTSVRERAKFLEEQFPNDIFDQQAYSCSLM